jgi:hypothetical protein
VSLARMPRALQALARRTGSRLAASTRSRASCRAARAAVKWPASRCSFPSWINASLSQTSRSGSGGRFRRRSTAGASHSVAADDRRGRRRICQIEECRQLIAPTGQRCGGGGGRRNRLPVTRDHLPPPSPLRFRRTSARPECRAHAGHPLGLWLWGLLASLASRCCREDGDLDAVADQAARAIAIPTWLQTGQDPRAILVTTRIPRLTTLAQVAVGQGQGRQPPPFDRDDPDRSVPSIPLVVLPDPDDRYALQAWLDAVADGVPLRLLVDTGTRAWPHRLRSSSGYAHRASHMAHGLSWTPLGLRAL